MHSIESIRRMNEDEEIRLAQQRIEQLKRNKEIRKAAEAAQEQANKRALIRAKKAERDARATEKKAIISAQPGFRLLVALFESERGNGDPVSDFFQGESIVRRAPDGSHLFLNRRRDRDFGLNPKADTIVINAGSEGRWAFEVGLNGLIWIGRPLTLELGENIFFDRERDIKMKLNDLGILGDAHELVRRRFQDSATDLAATFENNWRATSVEELLPMPFSFGYGR